ncbi:DUF72 domain-containing protein [Sphingomonas sp. BAUL-RG-20F-R05-02]|uniref:DUF72 domain-containing protein n=1 Tax=Sphingomonas sp. BAUL-RG-20F-R05-02 TaxID=2914830 RepID=UPI001F5A1828|nr:DUF72 domain-containing protein [Sphingomonas sp. BAUL-RG-20F-R05-02]
MSPPLTPDRRYIVVRGRLWRAANPHLTPERHAQLVATLMDARRAVGLAKRRGDTAAEQTAHAAVDAAKVALGERGAPWWYDGAPDLNRHMVKNTSYAVWYDALTAAETRCRIGTAGWSIPKAAADAFPAGASHLERYAAVLPVAEINSSFHRPHRRATYVRWAASVPAAFRFSVKLPKEISHTRKLVDCIEPLDAFVEQAGGLGDKLAVVLVQLPPSLAFDPVVASTFFAMARQRLGHVVGFACEPRHATWFAADADALLVEHRVARVATDPVLAPGGERPGGWPGLRYRRLHGTPRVYYSSYEADRLGELAKTLADEDDGAAPSWCIFDNTASGAATRDAVDLLALTSPDAA